MDILTELLPILICVVLPICIVGIYAWKSVYRTKRRSEIIIRAIEADKGFDPQNIVGLFAAPTKSPREILNLRLLRGLIFSFVGVALIVSYLLIRSNGLLFLVIGGLVSVAIGISYLIVWIVTRGSVSETTSK